MIIGINGKIGSGKDTIGRIIQYLIYFDKTQIQPSLGIDGHIANQILNPSYLHYELVTIRKTGWEDKKFAGKLKQIASLLTGIPIEKFEDQEFKKALLGEEWGTVRHNPLNNIEPFEKFQFNELMSVREFLQKLGTEAMRNGLHTNVWVNALFADYRPQPNKAVAEFLAAEGLPQSMNAGEENYPNWIITDMRFPNEMDAVKERKGITIRVVRPDFIENAFTGQKFPVKVHKNLHPSETALDYSEFDYEIINDGTLEDLVEKVRKILTKENII
jgi:hypothetical protein